jgi:hypothetical protein
LKESIDLELLLEFTKIENEMKEEIIVHDSQDETVNEKGGIDVAIESLGAVKIDEFENGR